MTSGARATIASGLRSGLQVIIQRRTSGGALQCRGYVGVPASSPALILIVAGPSDAANRLAESLLAALDLALLALGPTVAQGAPPCNGQARNEWSCHAHSVDACRKLLVVVTDSSTPIPDEPLFADWRGRGESHVALPILQEAASPTKLLPSELQSLNTAFWVHTPGERVDEVLGLAGIGTEDRRVFVSYRREESREIAEQLFEELPKHGFDVFVDRFRVGPGRNFQERLTDELADKAMVLVLESPTILESKWTAHELSFAKAHDLGRLALHLPGGVRVPWLDEEFRVVVEPQELDPPSGVVAGTTRLSAPAIERVVTRLAAEHTRAYLRRRVFLLDTLRAALTRHGAFDQRLDARGHLHIKGGSKVNGREYVVWASPRPPRVGEFRIAHGVCRQGPAPIGAIVTTAVFRETGRRAETDWLAEVSLVRLTDEGRIDELASTIARGGDLT